MAVAILGLIFEGEQVRGGQGDTVDSEKVIYPEVVEFATFNLPFNCEEPCGPRLFFPFSTTGGDRQRFGSKLTVSSELVAQVKSDPR